MSAGEKATNSKFGKAIRLFSVFADRCRSIFARSCIIYAVIAERFFGYLFRSLRLVSAFIATTFCAISFYLRLTIRALRSSEKGARFEKMLVSRFKKTLDDTNRHPGKAVFAMRRYYGFSRRKIDHQYGRFKESHLGHSALRIIRKSEKPLFYLATISVLISALLSLRLAMHYSFDEVSHDISPDSAERTQDVLHDELAIDQPLGSGKNDDQTAAFSMKNTDFSAAASLTSYRLERGETFVALLQRAGVDRAEAHAWATALKDDIDMRRLAIGDRFDVSVSDGSLKSLHHRLDFYTRLSAYAQLETSSEEKSYTVNREKISYLTLYHYADGTIDTSLYLAAKKEEVEDKIIDKMIDILAFDVDFQRDIRKGDRFEVYYERHYSPDYGDLAEGRILFASLSPNNRTVSAAWYEEAGKGDYFDAKGHSVRKALMKTPVDGARLSGTFGSRKHPVLGYTRMHKGLDFAAPRGTPIKAAGDGIIDFIGRNGGYGNFIRIRHGNTYHTAYAHLNRFSKGLKKGSKVNQGDIIGTVGTTGLSTGPHLHYEVMKNGVQIDPRRMKLPEAKKLAGDSLEQYLNHLEARKADIAMIQQEKQSRETYNASLKDLTPATVATPKQALKTTPLVKEKSTGSDR